MFANRIFGAALCLGLMASGAAAKCGTAALDGRWMFQEYSSSDGILLVVADGKVFFGGSLVGLMTQTRNCRVRFSNISGDIVRGSSDFVPPTSRRKPRVIDVGTVGFATALLVRQP